MAVHEQPRFQALAFDLQVFHTLLRKIRLSHIDVQIRALNGTNVEVVQGDIAKICP
jgi:hypothetical protein